ncbi:hypothetical protein [Ornithinimicrobium kibberense]|uniref:Uncharacterized protein n=1 Tax=Ornithinimicrobium kibberense TaxID=282060 RepID=A0ABV5UZG7_9MICO|nr:hypothetical protein [Ornithinimicrobium kibberense]
MNVEFKDAGQVVADERGRVAVGKAGVRKNDRYAVSVSDDGSILLTPLATVPRRELLIWEDQELRKMLALSLAQSENDDVVELEDLSAVLDEEDVE